jgi:hypothetical protein
MATNKITGAQSRMARAFLRWSIADLASAAGVGLSTVQVIEKTDGEPGISADGIDTTRAWRESERAESLSKIADAFTKAGITFLPDNGAGVGCRGKAKRRS